MTPLDLRTRYCGLELAHPIVASASPLSETLDHIRRMEDAGVAAIVMFSLFEEQIRQENAFVEHCMAMSTDNYAESLDYFPDTQLSHVGPEQHLDLLRRAVAAVDIPVIASLNGTTGAGLAEYARLMQEAGASALELNLYTIPTDLTMSGQTVEQRYLDDFRAVKTAVTIPMAVKLSPFFSAPGHMAQQFAEAGADGLVLFNRFYQPDFDLETLEVAPILELSTPSEIRLPLLWIAVLYGRVRISLAASTGVDGPHEIIKYLLAGADAVMTTSALLKHGIEHLKLLHAGLVEWMTRKGYTAVAQLKGAMSQKNVASSSAFERANYLRVLESYQVPL